MLKLTLCVFDTGAGSNPIPPSFLIVKGSDCIRSIHDMSLKSELKNPVHLLGKIIFSGELGDLHVPVYFGVVDNIAVLLLAGTSFLDWFVKGMFSIERRIVPNQSRPVEVHSKYMPLSDPPAVLQNYLDDVMYTDSQLENNKGTPLSRVVKCITASPNIKASVPVRTSRAGIIYVVPHPNLMQNVMVLQSSGMA